MRVALMSGCAQKALYTVINVATIRLLSRLGCEVVVAEAENVPATGFAAPAPEESNGAPPKQKRSKRAKRSKRN